MTEHGLLEDVNIWYAFAVILCVCLLFATARKGILSFLDGEIMKIRNSLTEAERLRDEAAETLDSYKAKQMEAENEARSIIEHAKVEADRLRQAAEAELRESLSRHEQKAVERIKSAELAALQEVRVVVVDKAIARVEETLTAALQGDAFNVVSDQAIDEIAALAKDFGDRTRGTRA